MERVKPHVASSSSSNWACIQTAPLHHQDFPSWLTRTHTHTHTTMTHSTERPTDSLRFCQHKSAFRTTIHQLDSIHRTTPAHHSMVLCTYTGHHCITTEKQLYFSLSMGNMRCAWYSVIHRVLPLFGTALNSNFTLCIFPFRWVWSRINGPCNNGSALETWWNVVTGSECVSDGCTGNLV